MTHKGIKIASNFKAVVALKVESLMRLENPDVVGDCKWCWQAVAMNEVVAAITGENLRLSSPIKPLVLATLDTFVSHTLK